MRSLYIMIIIILIAVFFTSEVQAMRCNGKLIMVGDSVYKLLKHCGEPVATLRDDWGSKVTYIYEKNGRTQYINVIDNVVRGGV